MAKKRVSKRANGSKRRARPRPAPAPESPHDALVDGEREVSAAKFALAPAEELRLLGERERSQSIPWGYGRSKVTAMAVDPERLYVYWEVTDEAIAKARAELGRSGDDSWLNLRVHDVTGLLFDGGNAHHTLDVGVARSDRQWFMQIGRPTSEVIVELGLLARDGRFGPIARSKRVEFPRRDPAPPGPVEWLDVRPVVHGGDRPHLQTDGAVIDGEGARGENGGEHGEHFEAGDIPIDVALVGLPDVALFEFPPGELFDVAEVREAPEFVIERGSLERSQRSPRGLTRVRYGPWSVVIRGSGAYGGGRVIARWEIRKSWVVEAGAERFEVVRWSARSGARRATLGGASELALLGASEERLAGASERRLLGGSELRLGGASELHWLGASERRLAGASERNYAGASEQRPGGASEERLLPAFTPSSAP